MVGGECAYWACIPSKTLLRPTEARAEARRTPGLGEPEQRWREIVEYRNYMIRDLDDRGAVKGYEESGVEVFKGEARVIEPGLIGVSGQQLKTERIVIATGSATRPGSRGDPLVCDRRQKDSAALRQLVDDHLSVAL